MSAFTESESKVEKAMPASNNATECSAELWEISLSPSLFRQSWLAEITIVDYRR